MKKSLCRSAVSVSPWMLAGLALSGMAGCVRDPLPFDAHAAREWELRTDNQVKAPPMYPLPTTGEIPYVPGETVETPEAHYRKLNVPEGPPVTMSL